MARQFRFKNKKELDEVFECLARGGTASPAILREILRYKEDTKNYPFREGVRS